MNGEGFAFFHWRSSYPMRRRENLSQHVLISMWCDVQRRAFYRKVGALKGGRK